MHPLSHTNSQGHTEHKHAQRRTSTHILTPAQPRTRMHRVSAGFLSESEEALPPGWPQCQVPGEQQAKPHGAVPGQTCRRPTLCTPCLPWVQSPSLLSLVILPPTSPSGQGDWVSHTTLLPSRKVANSTWELGMWVQPTQPPSPRETLACASVSSFGNQSPDVAVSGCVAGPQWALGSDEHKNSVDRLLTTSGLSAHPPQSGAGHLCS